jgi:hypothetical protein
MSEVVATAANCPLIARTGRSNSDLTRSRRRKVTLSWVFVVERVTRIELALSAWESDRTTPPGDLTCWFDCPLLTVIDPWSPGLMARQWPGDLECLAQVTPVAGLSVLWIQGETGSRTRTPNLQIHRHHRRCPDGFAVIRSLGILRISRPPWFAQSQVVRLVGSQRGSQGAGTPSIRASCWSG